MKFTKNKTNRRRIVFSLAQKGKIIVIAAKKSKKKLGKQKQLKEIIMLVSGTGWLQKKLIFNHVIYKYSEGLIFNYYFEHCDPFLYSPYPI